MITLNFYGPTAVDENCQAQPFIIPPLKGHGLAGYPKMPLGGS